MKSDCISSQENIELLDVINEGRSFRVHKARKGTKNIILKSLVRTEAMATELLRREYELGCTLFHPSIVTTLGFDEQSPIGPAILFEYIEGLSLDEFIANHPTPSAVDHVIDDILEGMDYLHHRGVLHNDLKPSNIIINQHGAARIIDFGLSLSDDSAYSGCLGGSQGYSAPEIMLGKGPVGAASDVFSIGQLINLLSPKKYRKIIERCSHHDPSLRYQSVSAIKRAVALRRRMPFVALAFVFMVFIMAMIIPSRVEDVVGEASHNSLKDHLRKEMSVFYLPALDSMSCQRTYQSAIDIRGRYLRHYVHYRDSLPPQQRLACEEIFAEQSAVLDSLFQLFY